VHSLHKSITRAISCSITAEAFVGCLGSLWCEEEVEVEEVKTVRKLGVTMLGCVQ